MTSAREEQYFDALSISSLGSDGLQEHSIVGSVQTVELYQRLQDLDELTAKFLGERRVVLNPDHDSFSDIEINCCQEFELKISNSFSSNDVLTLSVLCIPDCMNDDTEFWIDENCRPPVKHHALELGLKRKRNFNSTHERNTTLDFKYTVHNGELSFALTSADGVVPGSYILNVKNIERDLAALAGAHLQPVRISYRTFPAVRATPLGNGKSVTDRSTANTFKFYRFVCQDKNKLVSISVKSVTNKNGYSAYDGVDLYVTNQYNGLVAVGKEKYVWRCTNSNSSSIEIHPSDSQLSRGGTFIIGVIGSRDTNDFEITATISTPKPITLLSAGMSGIDCQVLAGSYRYFAIKIDPRQKGKIVLHLGVALSGDFERLETSTFQNYGRGVYTNDELPSKGVNLRINEEEDTSYYSPSIFLPPSPCQSAGVFPVLFSSSTSLYPSADDYTWRASGIDGKIKLVIEMSEWRYTSGTIYFSIFGMEVISEVEGNKSPNNVPFSGKENEVLHSRNQEKQSVREKTDVAKITESALIPYRKKDILCKMDVFTQNESSKFENSEIARYKLFTELYSSVDGSGISLRERAKLNLDDVTYSYGEIEYVEFQNLLKIAGGGDGQIFYDLVCGSGKAIVAAALSGIRFTRCVGFEIFPALCTCASRTVNELKRCVGGSNNGNGNGNGNGNNEYSDGYSHHHNSESRPNDNNNNNNNNYDDSFNDNNYYGNNNNSKHVRYSTNTNTTNEKRTHDGVRAGSDMLAVAAASLPAGLPLIEVRPANFQMEDWSDGDIIFFGTPLCSDSVLSELLVRGKSLKPGSKILSLKQPSSLVLNSNQNEMKNRANRRGNELAEYGSNPYNYQGENEYKNSSSENDENYFSLEQDVWCTFSWGRARVYILVRNSNPSE